MTDVKSVSSGTLTSQLAASLDLMASEGKKSGITGIGFGNTGDEGTDIGRVSQKSSARQLIEAKKAQRQNLDSMNALFIPFGGDQNSSSSSLGGIGIQSDSRDGKGGIYGQIAASSVQSPTYWKSKGSKKGKDKKKASGSNYKDKLSTKVNKFNNKQRRIKESKK